MRLADRTGDNQVRPYSCTHRRRRSAERVDDIQALKSAVNFRDLVMETHDLDRSGKVVCPFHDDHSPSCHIYPDSYHCFSCGAHGDALDWTKQVHNLTTAESIRRLQQSVGGFISPAAPRPVRAQKPVPTFRPVDPEALKAHHLRAAQLDYVPARMQGRSFSVDDLRSLQFAAYGEDAVFPIPGPDGRILALKRRYSEPRDGQRYRYTTLGHGCPAWCSPGFTERGEVLVVEGELNAMACFLARPELAVMGVAGTNGPLHLEALQSRTVYVYADGDPVGQKARDRWAAQALEGGAARVSVLDPWELDACDLAGRYGRATLREQLS